MSYSTSEVLIYSKGPSGTKRYTLDELGLYNHAQVQYFPEYELLNWPLLAGSLSSFAWGVHNGIWAVSSVFEAHTVVGGSGATVTVTVCPQRVAIGSGVAQLTAPIDLTVTAPSGGFGTLITTPTQMSRGDALAVTFAGTLTGLVGVASIALKRIG